MNDKYLAELRERLAAIEHERWASWQKYVHGVCLDNGPELGGNLIIPDWAVENWTRQINTKYADLSEEEKQSDREQVDRYWPLIATALAKQDRESRLAELDYWFAEYFGNNQWFNTKPISTQRIAKRRLELQAAKQDPPQEEKR